jgi:hypothetical protein
LANQTQIKTADFRLGYSGGALASQAGRRQAAAQSLARTHLSIKHYI